MDERKQLSEAFDEMDSFNSHLYDELAPLYDVLDAKRTDYSELVEFIKGELPEGSDKYTIVEGGCRSGNLLSNTEELEEVYRVLGVEPFESMASIASDKIEGTIINGSLEDARVYSEADAYIALEDSLSQANRSELRDIAESAYSSLNGNGVFIGQVSNVNMFENGKSTEEEFDIGGFDVTIKSVESKISTDRSIILSHITMVDQKSGDEVTRAVRRTKYYHDHNDVEDALYNAGFARVGFTAEPEFASEENPIILAWT